MGITEILTIIFVILKAFKVIDFTWFQCFIPEIIAGACYFIMLIIYIIKSRSMANTVKKEFKDSDWNF